MSSGLTSHLSISVIIFFILTVSLLWSYSFSSTLIYAQSATTTATSSSNLQSQLTINEIASNITQAKEAIASGNSTAITMQLINAIGELSDILGKITTDQTGQYLDEHKHYFAHKDHTHTVTHRHPHNADHHHFPTPPIPHPPIPPHPDWFEQHHIFNPNFCTPGLLC
jgi:hypothetical protein